MAGLSDYSAQALLNWQSGESTFPIVGSRFLALFTTAPTSDAGTGGTEVSGGSYARIQVAGEITAAGAISTASSTITMPNVSGFPWVVAGMNVYSITAGEQIGRVLSWTGTTLTLTANASNNGSGSTDSLAFSAFPAALASSGTEPIVTPASTANAAVITFAAATANWGTVTSFGIYDALTSGNFISWDYLGAFKWSPFTCSLASPGVLTCTDQSFSNGQSAAVTSKFGGTLPTTGGSWAGVLTVAGVSGSTFNLGVNTTGTGDGSVRQVTQQSIPSGVTASFAASQLTITSA